MANHKGSEGLVKIGANTVAEVRSWSLDESAATIPDSTMGDAAETHQLGLTSWSGQMTCYWDETDTTGQEAMTSGASVSVDLYPEGDSSGDTHYSGTATITQIGRSASHDGMVEATYSFTGNGVLTSAAVA